MLDCYSAGHWRSDEGLDTKLGLKRTGNCYQRGLISTERRANNQCFLGHEAVNQSLLGMSHCYTI